MRYCFWRVYINTHRRDVKEGKERPGYHKKQLRKMRISKDKFRLRLNTGPLGCEVTTLCLRLIWTKI